MVALLTLPGLAHAQSASDILPPTREEVTRETTPQPPAPTVQIDTEGAVERAPCALDGPDFANIRLTLTAAVFEDLQGLSPADLDPAFRPFVGQEHPIAVVCEIRDRAATILRNAGYVAAVQVPEQRIADGVVRFKVLMARLTQVRVRGNAAGAERMIKAYMDKLTAQPVFNKYQAERYLLLSGDLPGYTVRLTLRPAGTVPGEVIGDLVVVRLPLFADANIQNLGSKSLGRWGGLARAQAFGLTGFGDRTTVSAFSTADLHEQQTLQLGHDFKIGGEGLGIADTFTYAWARPTVPGARIKATTLFNSLAFDYPFYRTQLKNVRGAVGFDLVNQDVDLSGIELTRDRLRVAFARLSYDAISKDFSRPGTTIAEPYWRLIQQLEVRQGLSIFGATRDCGPTGARCLGPGDVPPSRLEGRATATVFRANTFGEFRPARDFTLALNSRLQYAAKPLLSFEEFSAGNYTVGRGYDPGAIIGDIGAGFQAEARYGSVIQSQRDKPALQAYAFFDHARVRNHDKLFVIDQSDKLSSLGGGARIAFGRFALDAALAVPLTKVGPLNEKPDPRVLISLSSRLWPWSIQ